MLLDLLLVVQNRFYNTSRIEILKIRISLNFCRNRTTVKAYPELDSTKTFTRIKNSQHTHFLRLLLFKGS